MDEVFWKVEEEKEIFLKIFEKVLITEKCLPQRTWKQDFYPSEFPWI